MIRKELVEHIKEQIARDPEGFVEKRMPYIVDKIVEDLK